MTQLQWDQVGERVYETGVDHGVLYIPEDGVYDSGYAWNGLTTVTESPSGAESTPQYADNIKYLNLVSAELFGGTVEAFTYPSEFAQCDGSVEVSPGVVLGQQNRHVFGLSYRTIIGNDTDGNDYGYKLHLIYGAQAAPSERAYGTVNDSPEAIAFSWEISTTPVPVTGHKALASLTIDSTKVDPTDLAALEAILYGGPGTDPRLPLPDEVIALFAGTVSTVTPSAPTFASNTITIPTVTGVQYRNDATDAIMAPGAHPITVNTTVKAYPLPGYTFTTPGDDDWFYVHS